MKPVTMVASVAVVALLLSTAGRADDRLDSLLARVPHDANAMMLVDVASLLSTDMADKYGWSVLMELRAQARDMAVPPSATMLVRSTQLDLVGSRAIWDLAVFQLQAPPDMQQIAAREGGAMDTIDGARVVWSPRDMYIVDMGGNAVAAYAPANRQQVSRWFSQAQQRKTLSLSPYLTEVAANADLKATQMVLALDLDGLISAAQIKPQIAQFQAIQHQPVDLDQLVDAIASIRGITLNVAFAEKAMGTLTLAFNRDVSFAQPYARDLVVEALRNVGMLVIEVQNWEASAQGQTITMNGPLFGSGLRRISNFFDAPLPNVSPTPGSVPGSVAETPQTTATDQAAAAIGLDPSAKQQEQPQQQLPPAEAQPVDTLAVSQAYYRAVSLYLDDVYKAEAADSTQLGDAAAWLERYARRIEQLPVTDVDQELLDWSAYVSARLYECSARLRDVRHRSAKRMAEHSNFYDTHDTGGSPTALVALPTYTRTYTRNYDYYGRPRGYTYGRGVGGYYYDGNRYRYSSYRGYDVYEVQVAVERYRLKYQEGERRQIGIEEKASGAQDAISIMTELKTEAANVRRDLAKKYNADF